MYNDLLFIAVFMQVDILLCTKLCDAASACVTRRNSATCVKCKTGDVMTMRGLG